MSYFVYIIYSPSTNTYYKGQTADLNDRLSRHNQGREKSTKSGAPWHLVWKCDKPDRSSAIKLELKLKTLSRKRLEEFIARYHEGAASPDES
jgi:putative endonuclease